MDERVFKLAQHHLSAKICEFVDEFKANWAMPRFTLTLAFQRADMKQRKKLELTVTSRKAMHLILWKMVKIGQFFYNLI